MQAQLEQVKPQIEADLGRLALGGDLSGNTQHERCETSSSAVRWLQGKLESGHRLQKTLVPDAAADGITFQELDEARRVLRIMIEWAGYGADEEDDPDNPGKKRKIPDMKFWSLRKNGHNRY